MFFFVAMEDYKFGNLQFQKCKQPLFTNVGASVSSGIFNKMEVIIKIATLQDIENPEREKTMLELIDKICPKERIFMKLLAYNKTETEHFFILEKAKMDLFTYLHQNSLTVEEKISIIYKLGYLANRLHSLGFAHCDISPENIVIYGSGNLAFIDAAQMQQIDLDLQFHVNIPGSKHEFDGKHPGKREYELPEAHYGKPYHLGKADNFAVSMTMWLIMVGKLPFAIDLKNPKNIVPYQHRDAFVQKQFSQLQPNDKLGAKWILFCDFLANSTLTFDLTHEFFF